MTMYERIKSERLKQLMSQQKLAEITGYRDRSSIAKIEAGFVDLPQSKIILFAKALSVSPEYLMGLSESQQPDLYGDFREAPDEMKPRIAKMYGIEGAVSDEVIAAKQRLGLPVLTDPDNPPIQLSAHEREVILTYRARVDLQPVVDRVLELKSEPVPQPKQA